MGYAAEMGFEGLRKTFKGYIYGVARNCQGRDKVNDHDDITSILEMVLHNCAVKYPDMGEIDFVKTFKSSVVHEMATVLSSKRIERSETIIDIASNRSGPSNSNGRVTKLAETIRRNEMTDKDYQDGINDILQNVNPKTALVLMEVMRPENRGKFVKGSKQAFEEVKKYLQG